MDENEQRDSHDEKKPYMPPELRDLGHFGSQAAAMGADCAIGATATGSGDACGVGSTANSNCGAGASATGCGAGGTP